VFDVNPFNLDALIDISVASSHRGSRRAIANKQHIKFLGEYLPNIGAETIVVEKKYVDRAFLEDYAGYYSRCFQEYNRFCTRLHFFKVPFSKGDLEAALLGRNDALKNTLNENYCGFIVLRPLPDKIFGRTCLTTYPNNGAIREFPPNRDYPVNLFGIDLTVNTLAHQEQDREVAACATSALWSLFNSTSKLFQHSIPSPVEITKAATRYNTQPSRSIPNQGLSALQQATAIRSVGLETLLIGVKQEGEAVQINLLKAAFYAYVKAKIPILISTNLIVDNTDKKNLGFHAITGIGYHFGNEAPSPIRDNAPVLKSTQIDRIYVHDDQVGPFSKLSFENNEITTSWTHEGGADKVFAEPRHIIVPLYHKIRSEFLDIYEQITSFDAAIEQYRGHRDNFDARLCWDIYLTDISTLRKEYLHNTTIPDDIRINILAENKPKYLWRATALHKDTVVLDLLFDATDLSTDTFLCDAVPYEASLPTFAASISSRLDRMTLNQTAVSIFTKLAELQPADK